ncbi:MAG: hypothetical protein HW374_1357 [Bacteroidetes bacterium]|nr:hypothetical protein [Bacteroidota bacterium]
MASNNLLLLILFIVISLLLFSCAGQVAPGGGPVDAIPPTIIHTEPDTNSVNVQTDRIVLEFSEYVDRRTVEESIFISPYVGQLEFDWSGRELTVMFTEQLKKNTSYVVNVGTDVIDVRASNRMASGFTLAFSTGAKIDEGVIKGRVFDEKPEGVMIFAYALSALNPDTLDPSKMKPDYIMQTGKEGVFALSHIRFDTYRIFAVRDEYRNLIYDKQIDQFGVTTRDIAIDEKKPKTFDVWFRLSAEDTTKPFLSKVIPLTRTHLLLRFSEAIDSASFRKANIVLKDTLSQTPVPIFLQSPERSDSMLATVVMATPLDSGKAYTLSVEKLMDVAGNEIDSANASYVFTGVGLRDTLKPKLEFVGLRDSIREIPLEQALELRFSEPVKQAPITTAITLLDSVKNKLPVDLKWITASSVFILPEKPLNSKAWYSVRVVMDSVQDFSGNTYKDSIGVMRFQSMDLKTTGTIEGFVVDPDTGKNLGEIFVTVTRVFSQSPMEKTHRLGKPDKFKFEQLPEGRYTLKAFRDKDSTHTFSYGRPFPFQQAERFAVYPDTMKVRARWGVEGVNINFKRDKQN